MMKHAKNLCEKNQKISGSLWSDDGRAVRDKANVGWLICYHLLIHHVDQIVVKVLKIHIFIQEDIFII